MKDEGITPYVGEGNDMTLAALLILGTAYAPQGDDGQIIQTAMLEFFKKSEWNKPSWSQGEPVAVDPKWRSPGRTSLDKTLKSVIAFYGKEPRARADVKLLRRSVQCALLVIAGLGLGWQTSAATEGRKSASDKAVIEGGLAAFFESASWNTIYDKGDFIAIKPNWPLERPSIYALIERNLAFYRRNPETKASYEALIAFRAKVVRDQGTFTAGTVAPLSKLALEKRFFVGDLGVSTGLFMPGRYSVPGSGGPSGTARALVSISPPDYSPGGRFAAFAAYEHCSHGTNLTFFLEKEEEGWKVAQVATIHYL